MGAPRRFCKRSAPRCVWRDAGVASRAAGGAPGGASGATADTSPRRTPQLGLAPPLDALAGDQVDLLLEAYAADPAWVAKGPAVATRPPPLVAGRLTIECNDDAAPRAVANFVALCAGDRGDTKNGVALSYRGVPFHRIVSGFVAQGGDVAHGRDPVKAGSGTVSIYGGKFKDEPGGLKIKHSAGTVGMANSGRHGNASQFYIALGDPAATCLDGKHVVIGHVVSDPGSVLARVDAEAASATGAPRARVAVGDCGVLPVE